ncbi:phosphoribosyltransferase family protein [Limisalsivibrio acetivorans]|uniref:phosphoribosyltransferase family protein n=1 Tax=Limisalsivibrio acetivorans TaxID=1304888 RepID=UPI0003B3E610|nr:phosphoribosyltransferase family protein [Limisalsivibrio acetivorans]
MRPAQLYLIDLIKEHGRVDGEIVKVDTFLNHQVDIELYRMMAKDIAAAFRDKGVTKVCTAETSGISIAHPVAEELGVNYIFAKKKKPLTMNICYMAKSYSFTKQEDTTLHVSGEVLKPGEKLLYVDDFLARGNTLKAVESIVEEAGAEMVGRAVIIDKQGRDDVYSILSLDEIRQNI